MQDSSLKSESYSIPSTVKGMRLGGVDPARQQNGFWAKRVSGGWLVRVSVIDVLLPQDRSQILGRESWASTTLFAKVNSTLTTTNRDVARTRFESMDDLDYNQITKLWRLDKVGLYDGSQDTLAVLKDLRDFAYALYNNRLSSPRLQFNPTKREHAFAQSFAHRITDISKFTPDLMVRELIRWANSQFTDVMTDDWRVPVQFLNASGRVETPLGIVSEAVFQVSSMQSELNRVRNIIERARRDMGVSGPMVQEGDFKVSFQASQASWQAKGYLPLGANRYARVCSPFESKDALRNGLLLSMTMMFGRQMARSVIGREYIESVDLDTPISLSEIRGLHSMELESFYTPQERLGQEIATHHSQISSLQSSYATAQVLAPREAKAGAANQPQTASGLAQAASQRKAKVRNRIQRDARTRKAIPQAAAGVEGSLADASGRSGVQSNKPRMIGGQTPAVVEDKLKAAVVEIVALTKQRSTLPKNPEVHEQDDFRGLPSLIQDSGVKLSKAPRQAGMSVDADARIKDGPDTAGIFGVKKSQVLTMKQIQDLLNEVDPSHQTDAISSALAQSKQNGRAA